MSGPGRCTCAQPVGLSCIDRVSCQARQLLCELANGSPGTALECVSMGSSQWFQLLTSSFCSKDSENKGRCASWMLPLLASTPLQASTGHSQEARAARQNLPCTHRGHFMRIFRAAVYMPLPLHSWSCHVSTLQRLFVSQESGSSFNDDVLSVACVVLASSSAVWNHEYNASFRLM